MRLGHQIRGRREYQEDRYDIATSHKKTITHVCIFDGHGGDIVSQHLKDNFLKLVKKQQVISETTIQKTVDAIETALLAKFPRDVLTTGSTFLYSGFNFDRMLMYVANVGDSRIVGCQKNRAVDLSHDHKPDGPSEKKRIKKMGYSVEFDRSDKIYRVDGYALSRAVGDLGTPAVIARIDFFEYSIKNYDYVVLASDGLWDVMESQDVVDFVSRMYKDKHVKVGDISKKLVNHAYNLGSWDNITVVIVPISRT